MNILLSNLNIRFSNFYGVSNPVNPQRYPNLAPLAKDTVSFTGRSRLMSESMHDAPSEITCMNVAENSEPAKVYLEQVLNKYLGQYVAPNQDSSVDKYPIQKCTTRKKTPVSIREKVVSKYAKIYSSEKKQFADQMYDELSQYFKVNPRLKRRNIMAEIKKILSLDSKRCKISPYSNTEYFVSAIVDAMQEKKYFGMESVSYQRLQQIKEEMVISLNSSAPKETSEIDPTTTQGVKHYANDIVGARVLLRESDPEHTAIVLNALKKAVQDGVLKITSIENNVPDPDKLPFDKQISDYLYATDAQLRSLANVAGAELIKNKSKSGYLAIHINVDLSNKIFSGQNEIFNGYTGEIQIIGADVEKLKNIEDFCYKFKDNKNAVHIAYKKFKDLFLEHYNESTKDAFDEYTYASYLHQRALPTSSTTRNGFASLKDLGFDKKLPSQLDFNNLRKIKAECDKLYKEIEDERLAAESEKRVTDKMVRKREQIKQACGLVTYTLNQV